jgi:hypothetical protein
MNARINLISPFDVPFESLNEMEQLALLNSLKLKRIMKKSAKTNQHVSKVANKENSSKEVRNENKKTEKDDEEENNMLTSKVQNLSITEFVGPEQDVNSKL